MKPPAKNPDCRLPEKWSYLSLQQAVPRLMEMFPLSQFTIKQMLDEKDTPIRPLQWKAIGQFHSSEHMEAQGASPMLALAAFWESASKIRNLSLSGDRQLKVGPGEEIG